MTNSKRRSFSRCDELRLTSCVVAAGAAAAGCFGSAKSSDASLVSDGSAGTDAGNGGPGTSDAASGITPDAPEGRDAAGDGPAEIALDGSAGDAGGSFVLSWQDDFDTLDLTSWQLQTFTYAGNEAQFSTQNAAVANGILSINLTPNPSDVAEPYLGVEMRSAKTLTYGRVSASMRFAAGSGVVSGLVLFYTPYPNCNWNEIDIEHLGDSSNTSQLNCQVYTGTVMPQCTTSVTPTQDPLVVNLGVNAEAAFHQYDIEWTPAGVTTFVDGAPLRTWTTYNSLMNLPQTVLLTIWASSAASWAGTLQADSAPTSAEVDWIKVYEWQP
jgi:endo-1,3-1,4-beta-glycanase ExoK